MIVFIAAGPLVFGIKKITEATIVSVAKVGEKHYTDNCFYRRNSRIEKYLSDIVNYGVDANLW